MTLLESKKNDIALAIESMVETKERNIFAEKKEKTKLAQIKNLSSATAKYFAEDDRRMAMVTLTFGTNERVDFLRMPQKKIEETASLQYNSLMSFIHKMRLSKKFKSDIRYFGVIEVQPESGALHAHILVSVASVEDMFSLVEFVQDFKGRYKKAYKFKSKKALPIGRSHIGISSVLKKDFESRYTLKPCPAKKDSSRIEHYMPELERREFKDGDWTPIEFYGAKMLEERYGENETDKGVGEEKDEKRKYENKITEYLTKIEKLDMKTIKEGVYKCQLRHDTKSMLNDNYINKLYLLFIRKIGRVYTHSRFPFSWSLYQKHRRKLIRYNPKYKVFYACIEDIRNGNLIVKNGMIMDADGKILAGGEK